MTNATASVRTPPQSADSLSCYLRLAVLSLCCAVSCTGAAPVSADASTSDAAADSPATSNGHLLTSDFVPPQGAGTAPAGAGSGGPWSTRIKLATSTDGLTFAKTDEAVTDQGGVPNAIVGHDGLLRIYYNAWFGTDLGKNVVAMAIRSADSNWFFHQINITTTLNLKTLADPCVVLLPDGKYRLYFMLESDKIVSATSNDSHDFVVDQDAAFNPTAPLYDPTVLKVDNGYVLATGPDGQFFATSTDGLTFVEKGALMANGKRFHTWSATARANKAGYRLYGYPSGEGGLSTMSSTTGETWSLESTVQLTEKNGTGRVPARGDVGVALMPDGSYVMAYLEPISSN